MKKLLMSLALASAASYGAVVDACGGQPAQSSFSVGVGLSGLNAEGYSCGDKLFNSFSGLTAPAGTVTIKMVNANLYSVSYVPTVATTTNFDLAFNASVATGTDKITSVSTQILTSAITGGLYPNTATATSSGTGSSSISNALMTGLGTGDDQQNLIAYAPGAVSTLIAFHFEAGANGQLQSYEVNIFESPTPTVPEPGSLGLLGGGLIGLATLARRLKAKN